MVYEGTETITSNHTIIQVVPTSCFQQQPILRNKNPKGWFPNKQPGGDHCLVSDRTFYAALLSCIEIIPVRKVSTVLLNSILYQSILLVN